MSSVMAMLRCPNIGLHNCLQQVLGGASYPEEKVQELTEITVYRLGAMYEAGYLREQSQPSFISSSASTRQRSTAEAAKLPLMGHDEDMLSGPAAVIARCVEQLLPLCRGALTSRRTLDAGLPMRRIDPPTFNTILAGSMTKYKQNKISDTRTF
ncbi:hypothetical protein P175DRAFT_0555541 [Aspergillus ochraceoroseus IBT 24754]|uniref:Uncharacterized protein n=1 Tax=Aspergillus ochraceoroseus IBT 24754 TaxID=1392256 RepID=A0A2T5M2W7_9EURO|nr:uncharacterized protein P175DRAFT_0555541 [Aspergillus ochraceoroseus IBT 24754]PTU22874.1 hypothetical protein P175DRAFT_0555541 [Aspergillus ochraceoroseus IBT 24754]